MKKEKNSIADFVRKIVLASLGSAAMAGRALTDTTLPKDVLTGILSRAERTKEDVMAILASEVSKFLGKINVSDEIAKSLKGLIINFHATLDFKDRRSPQVKVHSVKTHKK